MCVWGVGTPHNIRFCTMREPYVMGGGTPHNTAGGVTLHRRMYGGVPPYHTHPPILLTFPTTVSTNLPHQFNHRAHQPDNLPPPTRLSYPPNHPPTHSITLTSLPTTSLHQPNHLSRTSAFINLLHIVLWWGGTPPYIHVMGMHMWGGTPPITPPPLR